MGVALTAEAIAFLGERVFAHVATLMKDGSPQVTPVWVWTDGKDILINTPATSQKARNLHRDQRVAVSIMAPDNPFRTMTVRGRVVDLTTEGAADDINMLSAKYTGSPVYQRTREGQQRLTVRIEALSVRSRL